MVSLGEQDTNTQRIFLEECSLIGDGLLIPSRSQKIFPLTMNLEELANNRQASAYYDAARMYTSLGDLNKSQDYAFQAIDKALATCQLHVLSRCISLARKLLKWNKREPHAIAIAEYAANAQQKIIQEEKTL